MTGSNNSNATIVAWGVAAALCIVALGVALSYVIPAIAIAFGLASSIISTGMAVGVAATPAMTAAAGYGTAALAAVGTVHLTVVVYKGMAKQPLAWGAPILGLLSGFLVQSSEKYWYGPPLMWPVFAVAAGAMVLIGGLLYSRGPLPYKIVGALVSLVPPCVVLLAARNKEGKTLFSDLREIPLDLWVPLILLLVIAGALGALAHLDHKRSS